MFDGAAVFSQDIGSRLVPCIDAEEIAQCFLVVAKFHLGHAPNEARIVDYTPLVVLLELVHDVERM